jgi:hypothetical protein
MAEGLAKCILQAIDKPIQIVSRFNCDAAKALVIPGTPYLIKDWKSCWIESSNPKNQVQRSKIGKLSPEFRYEWGQVYF